MDVFTGYENAYSLYNSFDYFRRYPSEMSFFIDQLPLSTPRGTQVCQAKVSDYSNKRRVALGRCHPKQKNNCFKFDAQIQVGTIDHFLMFISANCNSAKSTRPADVTASCP